MKTRILSIPVTLFALALALTAPLAAVEPNESNLCMIDTENPAVGDLASVLGSDEKTSNYDQLNQKNLHGVFHSLGVNTKDWRDPIPDEFGFQLLNTLEGRDDWKYLDILGTGPDALFLMNGGRHQVLPKMIWDEIADNWLYWVDRFGVSGDTKDDFQAQLNDPDAGVDRTTALYKRFEFPRDHTELAKPYAEAAPSWEKDYKEIDPSATKVVIVIHGWQPDAPADPYQNAQLAILLQNLHGKMRDAGGNPVMPGWDLYAYNWSVDAATGGKSVATEDSHAVGGLGVAVENGTQAAEIGYQHGLVLGKMLRSHMTASGRTLEKVHFITHSAGTWVTYSASLYLDATKGESGLQQQITLLDPYNPEVGYEDWAPAGGESSVLGTNDITAWPGKVDGPRIENVYSVDSFVPGTNERYWGGDESINWYGMKAVNREVGKSLLGEAGGGTVDGTAWNGHGGPINYYAFSVNPNDKRTVGSWNVGIFNTLGWFNKFIEWSESEDNLKLVGWNHSMWTEEHDSLEYESASDWQKNLVLETSEYQVTKGAAVLAAPRMMGDKVLAMAAAPLVDDGRILVNVTDGWVRVMLVTGGGEDAVIGGPARLGLDGAFAMTLENGELLEGMFAESGGGVQLSLKINGQAYGQPTPKVIGESAYAGIGGELTGNGSLLMTMVLADGTAAVIAHGTDAQDNPWTASATGTVDENGVLNATAEDGFSVTGTVETGGEVVAGSAEITPPPAPEIVAEELVGTNLADGSADLAFGNSNVGAPVIKTVTVRNTGTADLTGLAVSHNGANESDFAIGSPGVSTLAPGASTTFTVSFTPTAAGSRIAALQIASNDVNENPFDIALSGTGVSVEPYDIAFVGTPYDLRVGNQVTFDINRLLAIGEAVKVSGKLPSGLKFNAATGLLTGIITGKPGTYLASIQILQGKTVVRTIAFPITVLEFPPTLIGNFDFLVEDSNSVPVGVCKITISGANKWSATLESAGASKKRSAKGSFILAEGTPVAPIIATFPAIKATSTVPGVPALTVTIAINGSTPTITGTYEGGTLRGFRLAKTGEMPPATVPYSLVLDAGDQDGISVPAGYGWMKGKVSNKGIGTFKGLLGDGTAASITLGLSAFGQAVLWSQPYKKKSSYIGGIVTLVNLGLTTPGEPPLTKEVWWAKTADPTTLSYPNGFPGMAVTVGTSRWTAPASATALGSALGWRNSRKAEVAIDGGGLSNQETQTTSALLPTEFSLDDKFNLITTLPIVTTLPVSAPLVAWKGKVSKTDGAMTGTLTIPTGFSIEVASGSAAASGVLVQDGQWGSITGCGQIKVPTGVSKGSFKTAAIVLDQ